MPTTDIESALNDALSHVEHTLPTDDFDVRSKLAVATLAIKTVRELQESLTSALSNLEQTLQDLKE